MWPRLASCNYYKGGCGSISTCRRSICADILGMLYARHVLSLLSVPARRARKLHSCSFFGGGCLCIRARRFVHYCLWCLRSANEELRTSQVKRRKRSGFASPGEGGSGIYTPQTFMSFDSARNDPDSNHHNFIPDLFVQFIFSRSQPSWRLLPRAQ